MPKTPQNDPLAAAVAAWNAPEERFSEGARATILARSRHTGREPSLPRLAKLFVPMAKIAWASAIPALVLVLVLTPGLFDLFDGAPVLDADSASVRIVGSKIGGEAVFRIANGGQLHNVYRSTSPEKNADRELLATTDRSFRDRLSGTTGVVYYRID